MKRFLLTMLVLLTAIVSVNAQNEIAVGKVKGLGATDEKPIKVSALKSGNSQNVMKFDENLSRINLDANERLCGYYTSDELSWGTYFTYYAGDHTAGSIFSTADVLKKAVGGTITKARVALYQDIGSTTVKVYSLSTNPITSEPLATGTINSTVRGWNDVTFDKPVTIVDGEDYLVTYDFTIPNMQGGIGQTVFMIDNDLRDYDPQGIYLLGDYGDGPGLYYYDTSCDLCIQLVVKGGSFVDDDVTLNKPSLDKIFYKSGDNANFSFGIRSTGNKIPSSYSLDVAVDGQVVNTLNSPVQLTGATQIVNTSITLPNGYSAGDQHTITVNVKDINGVAATEFVDDDMTGAAFKSYVESVARQKNYVEQYTSTECGWCPYGSEAISALKEKRSDIAVVAMHNSIMDEAPYYVDPFTIEAGDAIANIFASGLPSGTVNRYYVTDKTINSDGSLALGLTSSTDPQIEAQILSDAIDESNVSVPAFATVDISTSFNKDSRELSITVSGKVVDSFDKLVGSDAVLTVCLTEDGITNQQYKYPLTGGYGSYVNDYVHNSVLRAVMSENPYGDNLEWTDGKTYSKTYNVTLDNSWNAENMNVVAFIGRPITENSDIDDVWVNNANIVKVGETSTGISTPTVSEESAVEVARYSLDGTLLSAPTKGVNIVKMSDGTTRKVIVK